MPRKPRTDWESTRKRVPCPQCGKLFRQQVFEQAGRPKVYHNNACRQAAYRARQDDRDLDRLQWFLSLMRKERDKGSSPGTTWARITTEVLIQARRLQRKRPEAQGTSRSISAGS